MRSTVQGRGTVQGALYKGGVLYRGTVQGVCLSHLYPILIVAYDNRMVSMFCYGSLLVGSDWF